MKHQLQNSCVNISLKRSTCTDGISPLIIAQVPKLQESDLLNTTPMNFRSKL